MNKKSPLICLINIILLGMVTKIISMCSRIILSRSIGIDAVSIYSLVNPIFVFLITLSSFSLPTAISALISKYPEKGKKIFLTSLIILLLISLKELYLSINPSIRIYDIKGKVVQNYINYKNKRQNVKLFWWNL